jgi:hypothetical protein
MAGLLGVRGTGYRDIWLFPRDTNLRRGLTRLHFCWIAIQTQGLQDASLLVVMGNGIQYYQDRDPDKNIIYIAVNRDAFRSESPHMLARMIISMS